VIQPLAFGRPADFSCTALGRVAAQGSKIPVMSKGKPVISKKTGQPVMREASKHHGPWRERVIAAATLAHAGRPPLSGPIMLGLVLLFQRPGKHYLACRPCKRTGRVTILGLAHTCPACKGAGRIIKPDAPYYYPSAPDFDKGQRSIGDSLTLAKVWVDDRLVVKLHPISCKRYVQPGEHPGALIWAWMIRPSDTPRNEEA
jgi:Holliday junction resolvase RusA-like endonuclease